MSKMVGMELSEAVSGICAVFDGSGQEMSIKPWLFGFTKSR
jgi:hypothetical protein